MTGSGLFEDPDDYDTERVRLEDLEPGDEFLFNDRCVPCDVESSQRVNRTDGSITVHWEVEATGPEGAQITLQRTGSGRARVRESGPYGPFGTLYNTRRLCTPTTPAEASSSDAPSREECLRSIASQLFD